MALNTTRDDGATVRLGIAGSMTIYEAVQFKDGLLAALADAAALELDLGEVDEADTAGLQLLLLARREADRHARPLRIATLSPVLAEVIERYGLRATLAPAPALSGHAATKEMP